jgi:hypothetical protein
MKRSPRRSHGSTHMKVLLAATCIVLLVILLAKPDMPSAALGLDRALVAAGPLPASAAGEDDEEEDEEDEDEDAEAKKEPAKDGGPQGKGTSVGGKDIPLERLVELNARELFGGKTRVRGDEIEVTFSADGEMKAGFEGPGIIDSKSPEMKGANRRFIRLKAKKGDEPEQLIPGLCAVGIENGAWVSRFPVAGNPWVQMSFRVPNLIGTQSSLKVRVNWNKGTGLETSFFQTVSTLLDNKPRATRTTTLKEYQGPPLDWFPRKGQGVKVEFGIRDGKAQVRMDGKEVVSMPKVVDRGGKVAVTYTKLLFTLQDLKVTGKLDRAWCEKRIAELKASNKLKTAPDPASDLLGS